MTETSDLQLAQQSDESTQEENQPQAEEQQLEDVAESEAAEQEEAAEDGVVTVNRPAAAETLTIESEAGARYVIAFDPTEAQVQIEGNDFVLLFEDGARIVFANLVSLASVDQAPVLQVGDTTIGGNLIVAQAQALAGQQPTLETAAGDQGNQQPIGSGENRYNDDLGSIIDTLQAQPDIPYVERGFRLIELDVIDPRPEEAEPILPVFNALPSSGTVSEQFLPPRSPSGSQFDPAAGPGSSSDPNAPNVAFSGTLVFDQTNGGEITALRLSDGTVVAPVGTGGASETVTYDGHSFGPITADEGDFLFTTPLGNLLFVDHETGEYIYVLADNEAQPGVGQSGADDVIAEDFSYTATNDFGQTANASLTVNIQDDAPTAVDEALLKVFENGTVDAPDSVLENDAEGADGTETVTSIGVTGTAADQVAILTEPISITGTYGTLTINSLGEYSYTANDLGDPPPANPVDTFVYTIVDEDGDSSQATIAIEVKELPGGGLAVAQTAGTSYIPEDTATPVTLTASLGAAPSAGDILTQVVLDLPFAVDTTGTNPALWQIDLSQLETLFGVAEGGSNPAGLVTSWSFDEASGLLTVNLNTDPTITDPALGPDRTTFEATFDMTPPLDSDADIEGAVITATALDTVFGVSGTGSSTADVTVDAVVDGSEVYLDGSVIGTGNDAVGTNVDTPVSLDLTLDLGPDSTDNTNSADPSQAGTDGSTVGDDSEEVILVTVTVDQSATLAASSAATSTTDQGGGVTLYSFDTTGLTEAQVNALVASFTVTPATGVTEDISVTIETTTRELNTPPESDLPASGAEANTADNTDVDTYNLTIKILDNPSGKLEPASSSDGYIPEDVPTDVTLTATVGDPTNADEVLTQIVVDFGTAIDLNGSDPETQWQLDPADLAAVLALPEVTAVDLADGGSVLTITLDGTTQTFSADLLMTTPDDSDVDLDGVVVTVTSQDSVLGTTATGATTNDITADAIVDGSEVFLGGAIIDTGNETVGTTVNTAADLNLSLALGPDSTDQGNGDVSQGDEDGSALGDDSEEVILVTVTVDQGATLSSTGAVAPTATDQGGGVTLYSFDTTGMTEAQVNGLVASFAVTPATGVTEDINVTIETTTRELNTPPATTNVASGGEANTADNVDVDSYQITVKITEDPSGKLEPASSSDGYIPEDVPTDVTLSASVGDPSDTDQVLTQIVVDFGTAIDLNGSNPETQWQLDPADLAAILALPEVTAVDLADGGSVLTITLDGSTQTFSADLTMTTPDDSDVDLDGVIVRVTSQDSVLGTTASGETTNDIIADAIVDGSELFRNGSIINASNNTVGTNLNAAVLLGLTLELGPDSTDQGNGDVSQGDEDGSTLGDDSEEVILVTVTVDQGATLVATSAATSTTDQGGGVTLYSFDTTGLTEAQVSALVSSFEITPAADATDDIGVTIETTTRELNTPPATANAASGDEANTTDNIDVDSYQITVKVLDNPSGKLEAASGSDGYIPEDTETPVTLSATVGDLADPNEVLTQIVVDFGLPIDTNGSDPETQWQLDPASLTAILVLPEVTAVDLTDGGSVLTITLDGTTQTFSADLLLTPPLDSDVDLTDVDVTVTAEDSALGTTATGTTTNEITVDAIVDGTEVTTTAAASGLQNQFAAIDLNTEISFGEDSSNVGNSGDPSQADITDGSTADDVTEFVSSIVIELADKDSGTPTGTLEFQNPLPTGITVTENATDHSWTFEIDPSVSRADVESLVESFSVKPDFNYSGTLTANITTTTEELNTPPDSVNAASGNEANIADNIDVDSYSIDVTVEPISVMKQVEVSGGEPKPFNMVFVIDRSGSMDQNVQGGGATKFEVAEDAFRTLIQSIRDQGIDVANVRILGFNTGALDVTDFTSLPTDAQLDDFFDDLGNPNGGTRYEPPMQSASQFLNAINSSNPDVEYDNRIFFLSDGGNNNSAGGFLLGTSNGNDNIDAAGELSRLYGNVGDVGDDIPNLTIKSVGFGISKAFQGDGQSNIPGNTPVNAYLALDQSDDNMVNGSAIVSNANNGADLAASFGDVVDPSLVTGTLFDGHTFVGTGLLNEVNHLGNLYDAASTVDNADRDAAAEGDVVANDGGVVTFKTENGGFMTVWFVDQGGNIEGDFRYEGPPNFPGERTDSLTYVVQDDVGLQLGQLDVVISGQAPANGDFENGNLVDWDSIGSVYVEDNADLSSSNADGDDFVAVLATNNANGLDPRDGPGNGNREDEGVVDSNTLEGGNLTPVEDLGKDADLENLALYDESDLETFLASNGEGTNAVDLSGLVADDLLDGAVIQTSFQLDPLFGTPDGNQNLSISFDWNFLTDEGVGGENDIAFAVVEGQLFLLGSVDGSSFTGGAMDVGENQITYDRSTGWQNTTLSLGSDFNDVDGDNVIHIAFGVMDGGGDVGENSALVLDNVQADVS